MARVCPECGEQFDDAAGVCPYDGTDLEEVDEEASPLFGEVIDERFKLGEMIGEGGMGQVYKATQLSLDRPVAVKVIRGNQHVTEEVKKRFMREADVLSTLSHPNIVRIIDYGEAAEIQAPYLAMEFVDGLPLSELLDGVRFHPNLAIEVASQVAAGLVEAHQADVVHRDLKTDNVLLVPVTSGGFQAKLIDFGIAFPDQSEGERLTQTGMICGTPQYLSPEQARGSDVDERSDLYSLGIILFEMATGVLPFRGESAFEIMVSQVQNNPPGLIDFVPPAEIPDSLNALVNDLLAKEPENRPQDARDIRQRIQDIRAENGWGPIQLQGSEPLDEQLEPWLLGETPGGMDIETSETQMPNTYQGDEGGSSPNNPRADASRSDVDRQSAARADAPAPRTPRSSQRAQVDDSQTAEASDSVDSRSASAAPQRTPESKQINTAGNIEATGLQSRSLLYLAAGLMAATAVLALVAWQFVPLDDDGPSRAAAGADAGESTAESTVATSPAAAGSGESNADASARPDTGTGGDRDAGATSPDAARTDTGREDADEQPTEKSETVAEEPSPSESSTGGEAKAEETGETRGGGRPAETATTSDDESAGAAASPSAGDRAGDEEATETTAEAPPEPTRDDPGGADDRRGGGTESEPSGGSSSDENVDEEYEKSMEWLTNE